MTKNEIYATYTSKLNSIRYRLNNESEYMTSEQRIRYLAKEDLLKELLYDLAHMDDEQ